MSTLSYNPPVKAIILNRALLIMAFIGLFIAGALSAGHALHIVLPCGTSGGCEKVANHSSSSWFGIPVAYFGFIGYAALAGLAIIRGIKGVATHPTLVTLGFVMAGVGAAVSVYLQYVSLFVIQATCLYCLSSAVLMILTLITYAMLAQSLQAEKETAPSEPAPTSKRSLDTMLPVASGLVTLVALGVFVAGQLGQAASSTPSGPINKSVALIPPNPNNYGDPTAPITIIEFADLACPACKKTSPKVKEFVSQNEGKIRVIYRHFPLKMHTQSLPAALMAEYAADKGKFWDFSLAVMALEEEPASTEELLGIAKSVGLDPSDVQKHISDTSDPIYDRIYRDMDAASKLGIKATPTFFIQAHGVPDRIASSTNLFEILNEPAYLNILQDKGKAKHGPR